MPRPSLAAKRKEEILDAFEICILRDSLEATSLENLAKQAKMKRSILRHYIGNRDDIIVALSERYRQYFHVQWQQTIDWLPEENRIPALISILFDERSQTYVERSIVGDALFSQSKRLEKVRQHQLETSRESIGIITQELNKAWPGATEEKCELVATTVYANYMYSESLLPLGLPDEIKKLKAASELAIDVLKQT